jgi:Domain of unknown function (DUF5050)
LSFNNKNNNTASEYAINLGPGALQGDWIYYIMSKDSSSAGYYLYKMKTDGTGNVKISDANIFIVLNW